MKNIGINSTKNSMDTIPYDMPFFSVHRDIAHKFKNSNIYPEDKREGCFEIKFSKNQKLPNGYIVEFWECDNMYYFIINENPEFVSSSYCNRFMARNAAWNHFNETVTTCVVKSADYKCSFEIQKLIQHF
jgi:hypothetical protein